MNKNYCKLKKPLGKRVKNVLKCEVKNKKDYAWQSAKKNPFEPKKKIEKKFKIQMSIFVFSFLIIFSILLYHPFFQVKNINATGLKRIEEKEFIDTVNGMLSYKKFLFFPAKSYLLVDIDEIKDILKSKFPLESIIVRKNFPNEISVEVEEKMSTIIYDNSIQYCYLGLDGAVVEILKNVGDHEWNEIKKTVTSTDENGEEVLTEENVSRIHIPAMEDIKKNFGNYPIVYDTRIKSIEHKKKLLESDTVMNVVDWFNFITKKTDIAFGYILIENEIGEMTIKTREGWEIRTKTTKNIENQFENLELAIKEKVDRNNLQYIDLRFPERIYWK